MDIASAGRQRDAPASACCASRDLPRAPDINPPSV